MEYLTINGVTKEIHEWFEIFREENQRLKVRAALDDIALKEASEENDRLEEENQRLTKDVLALEDIGMDKSLEAKKYKRLYEKARECLSWYADEGNWLDGIAVFDHMAPEQNGYTRAQKCLEELEK